MGSRQAARLENPDLNAEFENVTRVGQKTGIYVMLCYVMSCYVMSCYVMLCYVMLYYVMLCYVMLCYVM